MNQRVSKKLIKQLQDVFIFEEKALVEFQYDCYKKLPGKLNEKELEQVRAILNTVLVQSLNHANIVGDLIAKIYGRTIKKL